MFDEVERVKRRQQKRVKRLRMQMRDTMPPYLNELHDPIEESVKPSELSFRDWSGGDDWSEKSGPNLLGIQIICSVLLAGFAYLVFQSSIPLPEAIRTTARDVLTRDFNFEGVAVWYETRFGHPPSILSLQRDKQTDIPVNLPKQGIAWEFPENWKLVKEYDPASSQIVIQVANSGQVVNGETGWVTFIGEKPGFGTTIIVQLSNQREAWYGNLETADVKVNDWVYTGQVLGTAQKNTETSHYLYLALRKEDSFINPLDVISFD